MSGRSSVVAVVDAADGGVVVWYAHVGLPNGMSRLCGAWVVEPDDANTLDALTFDRIVWPTDSGAKALAYAGVQLGRVLDPDATVAEAVAALDRCKAAFDADQAARPTSKRMTSPRWPVLPPVFDADYERSVADKRDVGFALASALWLVTLCDFWEDFEASRLARPLLRELDGPVARPLPVVAS